MILALLSLVTGLILDTVVTNAKKEYGMVGVNDTAISNSATPFGGVKHSGFGRENGTYGVEEYVVAKFVTIRTAK